MRIWQNRVTSIIRLKVEENYVQTSSHILGNFPSENLSDLLDYAIDMMRGTYSFNPRQ